MFFGTTIGTKISGHKKNTSIHEVVEITAPEKVYVPVKLFLKSDSNVLVNRGDKVLVGQKIAELKKPFYVPTFSSVSGEVVDMEERLLANGDKSLHIVIANDGKYERTNEISKISVDASSQEIVNAIKNTGIVGMGGAGFPAYVKYSGCEKGWVHTILINAVECEPFLTCDKFTTMDPENIIKLFEGGLLAAKAVGAKFVAIAVKDYNEKLIMKLRDELDAWQHPDRDMITVEPVADIYPAGWERTLIRRLFDAEYDRFPAEIGIVVNNVGTIIAMRDALIEGKVLTERLITVAGNALVNERTCKVPLYTPISHVISELGGYSCEDVMIASGGPMMGASVKSDEFVVTAAASGAIVQQAVEYIESPCLRCGKCTDHCPAGLQPVAIKDALNLGDFERLEELSVDTCIACGLCSFICPSRIELTSKMDIAKTIVIKRKKK